MKNVIFWLLFFVVNSSSAGIFYRVNGSGNWKSLEQAWSQYGAPDGMPNTGGSCQPIGTTGNYWTCTIKAYNGTTYPVSVEKTGKCNLGDSVGSYEYPSGYGRYSKSGTSIDFVQKISADGNDFQTVFCINSCKAVVARESDIGKLYEKSSPTPGVFLFVWDVKLTESAQSCSVEKLPDTNVPAYKGGLLLILLSQLIRLILLIQRSQLIRLILLTQRSLLIQQILLIPVLLVEPLAEPLVVLLVEPLAEPLVVLLVVLLVEPLAEPLAVLLVEPLAALLAALLVVILVGKMTVTDAVPRVSLLAGLMKRECQRLMRILGG